MDDSRTGLRLRTTLNRLVMPAGLTVALPLVAVAELLRGGTGEAVARRAVRVLAGALGVHTEILGAGRLDPEGSYVFVANHSSPLDIATLLLVHPRVRFAATTELFRIPVLRRAMLALRTIRVERGHPGRARQALDETAVRIREEGSVAVFPEGRMANPGELLPFKTGAFALAAAAEAPIVPVAIHNAGALMPRDARGAVRPGRIVAEVLEPIPTEGCSVADRRRLRDEARDALRSALRPADGGTASRPDLGPFP